MLHTRLHASKHLVVEGGRVRVYPKLPVNCPGGQYITRLHVSKFRQACRETALLVIGLYGEA